MSDEDTTSALLAMMGEERALRMIVEALQNKEWQVVPPIKVTRDKLIMVASDVIDLVLEKNADYGDAWQRCGLPGIATKMTDKWCRVETLASGQEILVVNENIEQSLIDSIGYAFLALLYLKEKRNGVE